MKNVSKNIVGYTNKFGYNKKSGFKKIGGKTYLFHSFFGFKKKSLMIKVDRVVSSDFRMGGDLSPP